MVKEKVVYIVKGEVTDEEAHEYNAYLGQTEWQFSDGPPGSRSSSADYLTLEKGLKDFSGYTFYFMG